MKLNLIYRYDNLWLLEQAVLFELDGRKRRLVNEAIPGLVAMAAQVLVGQLVSFFVSKLLQAGKAIKESRLSSILFSIIKTIGLTTFICAMIYCGFQFDAIRNISPALTSFIDSIGDKVVEYGRSAFVKMATAMPQISLWLVNSMAIAGISAAKKAAGEIRDIINTDRHGPQTWNSGQKMDPRFPDAEDTRTSMKPGDYTDPNLTNWKRDHDIYNSVKDEFDGKRDWSEWLSGQNDAQKPDRSSLEDMFNGVDKYLRE